MRYMIYNLQRKQWWLPQLGGFTDLWTEAGKFSLEAATAICENANIYGMTVHEVILPVSALPKGDYK